MAVYTEVRFEQAEAALAFDRAAELYRAALELRALPPEEGPELEGPPSYLRERVRAPAATGPAAALSDRAWCGHREPLAWIHEVVVGGVDRFTVRLPRAGATGGCSSGNLPSARTMTRRL